MHLVLFLVCFYMAKDLGKFGEDLAAVKELSQYVNSMVAFLLGLFMTLCINRWWDLRAKFLHGMMESSREFVFSMIAANRDIKYFNLRHRTARYALASHRLLYMCARQDVSQHNIRSLQDEGLLACK